MFPKKLKVLCLTESISQLANDLLNYSIFCMISIASVSTASEFLWLPIIIYCYFHFNTWIPRDTLFFRRRTKDRIVWIFLDLIWFSTKVFIQLVRLLAIGRRDEIQFATGSRGKCRLWFFYSKFAALLHYHNWNKCQIKSSVMAGANDIV